MTRLPSPTRPQLLRQRGNRNQESLVLLPGRKVVGTLNPDGIVTKRFSADRHAFRRTPGVGVNLEMVMTFDQCRPAPKKLLLHGVKDLALAWATVRAFAWDVLERGSDSRYFLHEDVDVQVLLPWEVFDGILDAPLAPEPPPEPEPEQLGMTL